MPLYEFKCECGNTFDKVMKMKSNSSKALCSCGKWAKRKFSCPNLVTDTSFCMTGKRDTRLDNEVIEGRKHWDRKLKEKGYTELSNSQLKQD